MQYLWVGGRVPGLNEILRARTTGRRHNPNRPTKRFDGYGDMKKAWGKRVELFAQAAQVDPIEHGSYFTYLFVEPNQRRDPLNFIAGGIKVIEDGLQSAGVLPNDNWEYVLGIAPFWVCEQNREPGCHLWIGEACATSLEMCLTWRDGV